MFDCEVVCGRSSNLHILSQGPERHSPGLDYHSSLYPSQLFKKHRNLYSVITVAQAGLLTAILFILSSCCPQASSRAGKQLTMLMPLLMLPGAHKVRPNEAGKYVWFSVCGKRRAVAGSHLQVSQTPQLRKIQGHSSMGNGHRAVFAWHQTTGSLTTLQS